MKVFFENISEGISISEREPMEAVLEQALEIFESLPEDDGSSFGLLSESGYRLHFMKYNTFLWIVELFSEQKEKWMALCSEFRCLNVIKGVSAEENVFTLANFRKE